MKANRLSPGGTIGIFCPSHVADMNRYTPYIEAIERLGFKVKLSPNFLKDSYGYAASAEERAADLNALVADPDVQMILFGGGDSSAEILPLIDYEAIRRNPKQMSSLSDGTPILNAIHAQTGLITYYGAFPGMFDDLRHYNYTQFCAHFVQGFEAKSMAADCCRKTIRGGKCRGTLIGGYTSLFGLMLGNPLFKYDLGKKYLLFLEDHERYSGPGAVATYLAFIGQTEFMKSVSGLIFGHFSEDVPEDLFRCLRRFGDAHNIPVLYTDDFGHGTRHGILPIGIEAELDANEQRVEFLT